MFGLRYVSEPDHVLHLNGFKNGKLHETLLQLDLLFKYINDKLANNPELAKRLDIIVTADHGHAEVMSTSFCHLGTKLKKWFPFFVHFLELMTVYLAEMRIIVIVIVIIIMTVKL